MVFYVGNNVTIRIWTRNSGFWVQDFLPKLMERSFKRLKLNCSNWNICNKSTHCVNHDSYHSYVSAPCIGILSSNYHIVKSNSSNLKAIWLQNSRLQHWLYCSEHLKYVWNVYCAVTNHRQDLHTAKTTGNEQFPIDHGTNYFCFVSEYKLSY